MRVDVLTLFPGMFRGPLEESILWRARERGIISIHLHDIRDFATDRHRTTDDTPYGGGGGMVMKPEPVFAAVETVLDGEEGVPVILLSPQGRLLTQAVAAELARHHRLVLVCGRYEGIDERVREHLISDEISIGDYVLSGGELAAMVVIEAVCRLLPGALGDPAAVFEDSHVRGLLEYPHYTRPAVFRDWAVPEVLRSGDHAAVARWRREQALLRTWERRPDLLERARLTSEDRQLLARLRANAGEA
jgi:tRNA (guanine37-N1)-methyltransferase